MLTSFFSKSKPVNFVVVNLYLLIFLVMLQFNSGISLGDGSFLKKIGIFLVLSFSIFLLQFISKKNEVAGKTAFKSILYTGFICMFPSIFENYEVLLSNLFVLLAVRRLISLKSQKNSTKKIFDATFWIGIGSIFYFWSVIFIVLVFFGILFHVGHKFKNWLVPIVPSLILLSISTSVSLIWTDSFFTFPEWFEQNSFNFGIYRIPAVLFPVAFLLALMIWSSLLYIFIIQKASANVKPSLILVLLWAVLSIGVGLMGPEKTTAELLFFLAPLALIVSTYFEKVQDHWFREVLLVTVCCLPILLLLLF